jgi:hypothetical protein
VYVAEEIGSLACCQYCSTEFTLPGKLWRRFLVLAGFLVLLSRLPVVATQVALGTNSVWRGDVQLQGLLNRLDWRLRIAGVVWVVAIGIGLFVASQAGLPLRMGAFAVALFACLTAFCFFASW